MASFLVCKKTETMYDRGEVTIKHTLEVMVAHSESVIENCIQLYI